MLDTAHLHRGGLWTYRVRAGQLEVREASGDWFVAGTERDIPALMEFLYGAIPPPFPWRPWHPIRDWFLRRAAKRKYERWKEQKKHSLRLKQKREQRLAQFKAMEKIR